MQLLGPVVPGTIVPHGVPIPGTSFVEDPVKAAFDITCAIRWLDYNDTVMRNRQGRKELMYYLCIIVIFCSHAPILQWLAAEWGHPSDNLGTILACTGKMHLLGGKGKMIHLNVFQYELVVIISELEPYRPGQLLGCFFLLTSPFS